MTHSCMTHRLVRASAAAFALAAIACTGDRTPTEAARAGARPGAPGAGANFSFATIAPGFLDLGTLPGGVSSVAMGLSPNQHYIAGASGNHAVLWTVATQAVQDLGTLPGGALSQAYGVNDNQWVVGQSSIDDCLVTCTPRAVLLRPGFPMQDLGTVGGDPNAVAWRVNNAGMVVGYSYGGSGNHAFVWTQGAGLQAIGALPGQQFSSAFGVNAAGVVVGNSDATGHVGGAAFTWSGGVMHELPTPPGEDACVALAINSSGEAAGNCTVGLYVHAVHWRADGTPEDLGTLGGTTSSARGIGDDGTVVGEASTLSGDSHAFSWTASGGMLDLDPTLTMGTARSLSGSLAVGEAQLASGQTHAVSWHINSLPMITVAASFSATEGTPATYAASAVDADGDPLTFTWDFNGDGVADRTGATVTYTYVRGGSHTATVTVSDGHGTSSTSVPVTVQNVAPTAAVTSAATFTPGVEYDLWATVSDPGQDAPWSVDIDWGDGTPHTTNDVIPTVTGGNSGRLGEPHTYARGGSFTITIRITDADGASSSTPFPVTGASVNHPPTLSIAAPSSVPEGSTVHFVATVSDPDGDPVTVSWDVDGVAGFEATGLTLDHVYADNAGSPITITARATDGRGGVTTVTQQLTVTNVAPSVSLLGGGTFVSGQTVNMSGGFTDPGSLDAPWSWSLDWGDGTHAGGSVMSQTALNATRSYLAAGTYTVTLRVTDKDGGTGAASVQVVVNRLPVAIDVLPGSDENHIEPNAEGDGKLPVAVLSSATFDARTVDVSSVRIGTVGVARRPNGTYMISYEDVNGDGRPDLVLKFDRRALITSGALTAATTQLVLVGTLRDGRQFAGQDAVTVN